jgi:PAS domain S-box-containing protein
MSATGGAIRVLHVDDEPDFAEMVAGFLEREDDRLVVDTATNVSDGLDQLGQTEYDCIVSDYEMPNANGLDFLELVRNEYADLPFILYTGKGSEEVASDAISAGVTDYLQKKSSTDQYTLLANRITNAVEKSQTQQALTERTRQLETLISNLPGMVYRCRNDPTWPMEAVEGEVEKLTGYSADALESDEVLWGEDILHPDDRGPMWEAVQDGLAEDGSFEVTYRIVTHDGTTKWMWERGRGVSSEAGELEALEGFVTDITDHREREHELERTNAVLSTLFETLPVGVLAEDADRNVLAVNERMFDLFELPGSPPEVVDADCERMAEEVSTMFVESEQFVTRINELIADRESIRNEELSLRDGRKLARDHEPIELSDGEGHLWVYRDITDRKEREQALEQLQQRTQTLMQTTTREETAQVAVDSAREVLGAQLSGCHLLGPDQHTLEPVASMDTVREEIGGPPAYDRTSDDPASRVVWQAFESGDPRILDDTREIDGLAAETPARSGLIHPLADYGVFIVSATEPHAFDDTDKTLAEIIAASLTAALDRVEREQELRLRNERLDQFASVVSHDLRSPLKVAQGYLDLAREDVDHENLDAIEGAHDRMESLIEDLLDLARTGETIEDPDEVSLTEIAEACWDTVETDDATLVTETDDTVRADRSRLQQLLENLIRNAVEHGGADVTVTVGGVDDGSGFYLEDDGVGIPEAERGRIFEAGYTTTSDGTGFGLSIVKEVAEAHGWNVTVTDSDDGGAQFEITGVETVDR